MPRLKRIFQSTRNTVNVRTTLTMRIPARVHQLSSYPPSQQLGHSGTPLSPTPYPSHSARSYHVAYPRIVEVADAAIVSRFLRPRYPNHLYRAHLYQNSIVGPPSPGFISRLLSATIPFPTPQAAPKLLPAWFARLIHSQTHLCLAVNL